MRHIITAALVLILGVTAAGCHTGTAGAASSSWTGPYSEQAAQQEAASSGRGQYHANRSGHVAGFPPGPWDAAGKALQDAAKDTSQGLKNTGKDLQKAAEDTGKDLKQAAEDTGKDLTRAGKEAAQAAKDAGQDAKHAIQDPSQAVKNTQKKP